MATDYIPGVPRSEILYRLEELLVRINPSNLVTLRDGSTRNYRSHLQAVRRGRVVAPEDGLDTFPTCSIRWVSATYEHDNTRALRVPARLAMVLRARGTDQSNAEAVLDLLLDEVIATVYAEFQSPTGNRLGRLAYAMNLAEEFVPGEGDDLNLAEVTLLWEVRYARTVYPEAT